MLREVLEKEVGVKEKLQKTISIFNHAAKAYKRAQDVIDKVDDRILHEFQYYSRAMTSLAEYLLGKPIDKDFYNHSEDANTAAKHLLNDSLDILIAHASIESENLEKICELSNIKDVYPNYDEVYKIITSYSSNISTSRSERGERRVNEYIRMVESNDYEKLISYCQEIPKIREKLKEKRKIEIRDNRLFALAFLLGIGVLLGTLFFIFH